MARIALRPSEPYDIALTFTIDCGRQGRARRCRAPTIFAQGIRDGSPSITVARSSGNGNVACLRIG